MPINPFDTSWLNNGIPAGSGLIPTFGIPRCIFELGFDLLSLMPGDALNSLSNGINKGVKEARKSVAKAKADALNLFGLRDSDGDEGTEYGVDSGEGGFGESFDAALGAVGNFIGQVQGYQEQLGLIYAEVQEIISCLESFFGSQQSRSRSYAAGSSPASTVNSYLYETQAIIENAANFMADADETLSQINEILELRNEGVLEEPELDAEEQEAIFRLTFGPPKSKAGSFLLSVDGLYYNSQTREYADGSEVPTQNDLVFVPDSSRWKLDHSPNLGGKGTYVTVGALDKYVDTLFDIEKVDDGESLQEYYDRDHTISVLKGNKSKSIGDLERDKQNLIASGYEESSAIVQNLQQQIFSTIESYDVKIRKRKKQIEVAVKSFDLFGAEEIPDPGDIPLNDFSYLGGLNIAPGFEKQRKLVLDHGEVSGVVLPIKPVFVKSVTGNKNVSLTPLHIGPIGTGVFADTPPASSTIMPALTISDSVVLDNLVAIYSFLDAAVENPRSTKRNVISCNNDSEQDAQLVGRSPEAVFSKGLGIPLLEGIVSFKGDTATELPKVNGVGSYLRLPDSKRMQDLMFNLRGCSIDTWIAMKGGLDTVPTQNRKERGVSNIPVGNGNLTADLQSTWMDYQYYKILLANENIGGDYTDDAEGMPRNKSSNTVRGMLMGFTRDPQITTPGTILPRGTDTSASYGYGDTLPVSATVGTMSFFIAPTQSVNGTDVEFVRSSTCVGSQTGYDVMSVSVSATTNSGYSFMDVIDGFVHLNVSFDVQKNAINIFLNGELLETSAMSTVFGINPGEAPKIPSFIKTGDNPSFAYSSGTVDNSLTTIFDAGPKNDPYFTPWIVGGGWTDGITIDTDTSSGGFMSTAHGFSSGFGGRIGSLKIYDKPLDIKEVNTNYNAHKAFFTKIEL